MRKFKQLTLPLRFDQASRFNNYYHEDSFIVDTIKSKLNEIDEVLILINGESGSGKSHLLNASAIYCQSEHIPFQFFEANMLLEYGVEILADSEKGSVLIIDDIHLFAQNPLWERQLYDLYNRALREQWILLFSCLKSQIEAFELNDWVSRMKSGLNITLTIGSDDRLKTIIQYRSEKLGLRIKDDVIEYLLKRYNRDLNTQLGLIHQLNKLSLEFKKNITIPFAKDML